MNPWLILGAVALIVLAGRPAMAKFKDGVVIDFADLRPTTLRMLRVAELVFASHGYETIVTSARDSEHSATSLHYSGDALDFRTRHIPTLEVKQAVTVDLRQRLGRDYDVILESTGTPNEHIHVEYDPK